MEKNPGSGPEQPLDPTAAAFGDGLPDPFDTDAEEERSLTTDKVIDDLQGPDIQDPNHTYLPE